MPSRWRSDALELQYAENPADSLACPYCMCSYLAIPVEQVADLMRAVGFEGVRRVDDRFFQPVLVGTRPVVSSWAAARCRHVRHLAFTLECRLTSALDPTASSASVGQRERSTDNTCHKPL